VSDALSIFVFALLSAANPTLLAAVTIMLLLPNPKRLMMGYLLGAYLTSITIGLLVVFELHGSEAVSTTKRTLSPIENLVIGSLLIIAGLVLRLGLGAESLAWAAIFFIQPFSGVYYPVATLPAAVRWIAWLLPSAPVFEGMRAVLIEHRFDGALFAQAVAVLLVWLVLGGVAFTLLFQSARRRGLLLQSGE